MDAEGYAAILVAAGRSSRFAGDKLWADLWGRPTWRWSLDIAARRSRALASIAIAVPPTRSTAYAAALLPEDRARCLVVPGGDFGGLGDCRDLGAHRLPAMVTRRSSWSTTPRGRP